MAGAINDNVDVVCLVSWRKIPAEKKNVKFDADASSIFLDTVTTRKVTRRSDICITCGKQIHVRLSVDG